MGTEDRKRKYKRGNKDTAKCKGERKYEIEKENGKGKEKENGKGKEKEKENEKGKEREKDRDRRSGVLWHPHEEDKIEQMQCARGTEIGEFSHLLPLHHANAE